MGLFTKISNNSVGGKNNIEPVSGDLFFAFDLGTSVLRLCAAQVDEYETVTVVGYREIPSAGIIQGSVADMNRLKDALNSLLVGFERDYNVQIRNCIVGVAGTFIASSNQSGSATVKGNTVTFEDQIAANENARSGSPFNENDFVLMHTVIQCYTTDSPIEVLNPLGQFARKLDVRVHLVALRRSHEQNICNAFAALKPELSSPAFIYSGIAAADAVLTTEQKQMGVIFMDIGAGSTNVAVYSKSKLQMTFGLNHGGDAITEDISQRFGLPLSIAEQMKIQCGCASPEALPENVRDKYITGSYGVEESKTQFAVAFYDLAMCINYQLKGIFEQVINHITTLVDSKQVELGTVALVVLTGGVALTSDITSIPVTVGAYPLRIIVANPRAVKTKFIENLKKETDENYVNGPDKAVTIGLIRNYYHDTKTNESRTAQEGAPATGVLTKVIEFFRKEF